MALSSDTSQVTRAESAAYVYAVRLPWDEGWDAMAAFLEDLFGEGCVIEFDLGPMARYPRITEGCAQALVCANFDTAARAARELCELHQAGVIIERAWPTDDVLHERLSTEAIDAVQGLGGTVTRKDAATGRRLLIAAAEFADDASASKAHDEFLAAAARQ